MTTRYDEGPPLGPKLIVEDPLVRAGRLREGGGYSRAVFTVEERDRVRERLLALAAEDPAVVGAAITGSHVADGGDEWSDIDLAFAIRGEPAPPLEHWTKVLYGELAAIHHLDLPWGSTVRSLDKAELRRALAAAAEALAAELERSDPKLADRLRPMLHELTAQPIAHR